ncbi:putative MATE efflux family protein subfamily [Neohortaea acidophila]|uniref:Putative MATE efflux family protein subfamily n=1 Tax=Neohortaea acidophila TaxID=245834 RepID=A0A6A6PTK3_9PEZI|nr:putative MATE efflux family protein subfamily [Neohortaea acidophila]KAF2483014.1 putative MATE efflux family protein subfamily [Neohortaea acidophila]
MGSAKDRGVRTSHGGPSTASSSDEAGQSTSASIAEESIRRDLEDESAVDAELRNTEGSTSKPALGQHSLATGRRGSSNVAASSQSLLPIPPVAELAVQAERSPEAVIEEERTLLRDNKLLPDSTQPGTGEATETTALLNASNTEAGYGAETTAEAIDKAWEDAVLSGQIQTTWQREAKVVASYSSRLMLTYFLQQSLTLTTIFTAGRLGKNELAAVSLGSMTAVITGYSVYYGLTTSLDTLCAQAYGRGNKKLVGLYMQRMVYFSWLCTIPIAVVWYASPYILAKLVPEKEIAMLSGRYLRVLIFGAPAFACFESSKRYVQAQGRFNATLCVLLFISPLNVLLQYIFVWKLELGFIGSPLAVAIAQNLMPLGMFTYVQLVGGKECWPGFSRKAFKNWGPMVSLALPGFIMLFAEIIAFEVVTLAAARISATHLAANSILQSLCVIMFTIPFPVSIAGGTRMANLIGASLPDAARVTSNVLFVVGAILGTCNVIILYSGRSYIPYLYTHDSDVAELAAATLPINAAFQLFDAIAAQCNGMLRGLGKQKIGGYVSLFSFYGLALPVSFGTAFGLGWDLTGLWCGPAIALFVQAILESIYVSKTSFQKASEAAARRSSTG